MKRGLALVAVISTAIFAVSFTAAAQDEDVRGAFMTTRPKQSEKPSNRPAKAVRRRPKASPTGGTTTKASSVAPADATKRRVAPTPAVRPQKLGMGLTLYMRDSNGLSTRVDPSRAFRTDERVRLLLETNADGYLYVFNTTDNGAPLMIYPDPELDEGGNYIQAHVPVEVPSSFATEERLRWFRFDAQPGTERLYFVFTREPLQGIPLEDELIGFCKEKNPNCPIRPAPELWAEVQKNSGAPIHTDKSKEFGAIQTAGEQEASTRGIGLNKDDPEPSLVMMTASSSTTILVATLELVHK